MRDPRSVSGRIPSRAWLVGVAGLALGLGGCAGGSQVTGGIGMAPGGGPGIGLQATTAVTPAVAGMRMSAAQSQLREEAARFNQTVATGTVAGAGVGALAGYLICGRDCAAIGAVVGGVAGAGAGNYVAAQNQQAASAEVALQNRVAGAEQEIQRFERTIAATKNVIADHKRDIAALKAKIKKGEAQNLELSNSLSAVNDDVAALKKMVEQANATIAAMDQDLAQLQGPAALQLRAKREQVAQQRAKFQGQIDELSGLGRSGPA